MELILSSLFRAEVGDVDGDVGARSRSSVAEVVLAEVSGAAAVALAGAAAVALAGAAAAAMALAGAAVSSAVGTEAVTIGVALWVPRLSFTIPTATASTSAMAPRMIDVLIARAPLRGRGGVSARMSGVFVDEAVAPCAVA